MEILAKSTPTGTAQTTKTRSLTEILAKSTPTETTRLESVITPLRLPCANYGTTGGAAPP